MTELLEKAAAAARSLSPERQDEIARMILLMARDAREDDSAFLREAWNVGVASGEAAPVDLEALKAEARRRAVSRGA